MKMITLEKVYRSLKEGVHRVTVDESIAAKARIPINRMLDLQRTSPASAK
jgi:quinolinate synthase